MTHEFMKSEAKTDRRNPGRLERLVSPLRRIDWELVKLIALLAFFVVGGLCGLISLFL